MSEEKPQWESCKFQPDSRQMDNSHCSDNDDDNEDDEEDDDDNDGEYEWYELGKSEKNLFFRTLS